MLVVPRMEAHNLTEVRTRIARRGERRREALRVAEEELEAMRPDLLAALEAGLTISELARLAAVSRPTLYELRQRA